MPAVRASQGQEADDHSDDDEGASSDSNSDAQAAGRQQSRRLVSFAAVTREARLGTVLALNLTLIAALVIVGVAAHSLGVLAAGGDYLADAAAIGLSLLAIWLSHRPGTPRRPDGYPKATAIAALVNGLFLLVVVAIVIAEAIRRLTTGVSEVHGLPVMIVSGIAAVAMGVGAVILGGDVDQDDDDEGDTANVRAVLLDTVADAAAAAGVAVTGAIIAVTGGLYWLDPVVALAIAIVVGYHVGALLWRVVPVVRSPAPASDSPAPSHLR
jgi:cobalt-zinc-cadmium efflux system protein